MTRAIIKPLALCFLLLPACINAMSAKQELMKVESKLEEAQQPMTGLTPNEALQKSVSEWGYFGLLPKDIQTQVIKFLFSGMENYQTTMTQIQVFAEIPKFDFLNTPAATEKILNFLTTTFPMVTAASPVAAAAMVRTKGALEWLTNYFSGPEKDQRLTRLIYSLRPVLVNRIFEVLHEIGVITNTHTDLLTDAVRLHKPTILAKLLQLGINPNLLIPTPLMVAAVDGDQDSMLLLLRSGASTNIQDYRGDTALVYALNHPVRQHIEPMIAMLINAGANPTIENSAGNDAYSFIRAEEPHFITILDRWTGHRKA